MSVKLLNILILIAGTVAITCSVYRDIGGMKNYYGADLRNRIVGARLIRDGRSPYFYKWEKSDGVRYYDPENNNWTHSERGQLSVITATPFFHHLLWPLTPWPQRQLARIWLGIEYGMWLAMVVLALSLAGTPRQKSAVLVIATLFLFTEAWIVHVAVGQYYLCIPFLAMLCYYLLQKNSNWLSGAAAGLIAVSLVLIRPNAILFFIPFFALIKNYTRPYLIAFFIPVFLLLGWSLFNKKEYALWQDYRSAVAIHVDRHQHLDPFIPMGTDPDWKIWEGIDQSEARDQVPDPADNEHGNFFLLFRAAFHRPLPLLALEILSGGIITLLVAAFWYRQRSSLHLLPGAIKAGSVGSRPDLPPPSGPFTNSLPRIALFGYCLYMISDLFSPIYRWQYYTLQWIFPVLLATAIYDRRDKWPFGLLMAGLGLNLINTTWTGSEHSLGEYLMLVALLSLSFHRKPATTGLSYP